jgi:hypothetical protein
MANYVNFLGYNIIMRNIQSESGRVLRRKTDPFFYGISGVYIINLLLALCSWFYGPWCAPRNLYPPCMTMAAVLYWCNYLYHVHLRKHNYFLDWQDSSTLKRL